MRNLRPDNDEPQLVKDTQTIDLVPFIDPRRFRTLVVNADCDGEIIFKVPADRDLDGFVVLLNRTLPCIYY